MIFYVSNTNQCERADSKGSGQIIVDLPDILHTGDYLMVGDTETRWRVKESTLIVHDEFHPKKNMSIWCLT